MILIDEPVPGAAVFGALLPKKVRHHSKAIVEIVTHIEERYKHELGRCGKAEER
jgi:hypothetical protein